MIQFAQGCGFTTESCGFIEEFGEMSGAGQEFGVFGRDTVVRNETFSAGSGKFRQRWMDLLNPIITYLDMDKVGFGK